MNPRFPVPSFLLPAVSIGAAELAPPIRIIPDDLPCAAPFCADIDGDGLKDLLVGTQKEKWHEDARVRFPNLRHRPDR